VFVLKLICVNLCNLWLNFEAKAKAEAKGVCSEINLCNLWLNFEAKAEAEGVCSKINQRKSAKSASSAFNFLHLYNISKSFLIFLQTHSLCI